MAIKGTVVNPKKFSVSQIKFYIILFPLAIFMGLPILFIFVQAFKPMSELFEYPPKFYVVNPTFDNFVNLFNQTSSSGVPFSRFLFNSIVVTAIGVTLTVFITTLSAYALSKMKFKLKKPFFKINQMALMFVSASVAIPRYLVITNLGITNTFLANIIPLLAIPVGLFLVKQFIDGIPDELIEAAKVDGATEFEIYYKIIIPVIKPAMATIGILAFQTFWNNTETSSLFITDESQKTLAFFLQTVSQNGSVAGAGIGAAASLLMFLPNLIFFIIIQSKVMDTMAHSGIK